MNFKTFNEQSNNKYSELSPVVSTSAFINKVAKKLIYKQRSKSKFTGNRAMAKLVKGHSYLKNTPPYYRLSIAKSKIVKSKEWQTDAQKLHAIQEHLRYLIRNEVAIDGTQPNFFNDTQDNVDSKELALAISQDRHHFRFIISPEDGRHIDLKAHARELILNMERDLNTKLEWVGVEHHNTDNPHIHLVIRGADKNGKDLIMKPDYITHGIRARSSELLTLELGPRSELEIIKSKRRALLQNRAIPLDYKIAKIAQQYNGKFTPAIFSNSAEAKAASIRIKHLQNLQLAARPNGWPKSFYKIEPELIERLKDLEAHHDIYKRISRFGINEARQYTPKHGHMIGRVMDKGLQDELTGSFYIIVNGADGHKWYVDLSKYRKVEVPEVNQIIAFEAKKTVGKNLGANNTKIYTSNKIYSEPIKDLKAMVNAPGVTLLDKCIINKNLLNSLGKEGFGKEMQQAVEQRRLLLVNQQLAVQQNQKIVPVKNLIEKLRNRELEQWKNKLREKQYSIVNHIPNNFTGVLIEQKLLSGINYTVIQRRDMEVAIVPVAKKLDKLQGQKVTVTQGRGFVYGLPRFSVELIGRKVEIK